MVFTTMYATMMDYPILQQNLGLARRSNLCHVPMIIYIAFLDMSILADLADL